MKFVFIVNERAGGRHATDVLRQEIANSGVEFDYEIYVTKARLDATDYVKNYCKSYKDEACFVACGGDGTVKEVVSGLVGEQNKYFAVMVRGCFPGSGRAVCSSFFSCLLLAHICPPFFVMRL